MCVLAFLLGLCVFWTRVYHKCLNSHGVVKCCWTSVKKKKNDFFLISWWNRKSVYVYQNFFLCSMALIGLKIFGWMYLSDGIVVMWRYSDLTPVYFLSKSDFKFKKKMIQFSKKNQIFQSSRTGTKILSLKPPEQPTSTPLFQKVFFCRIQILYCLFIFWRLFKIFWNHLYIFWNVILLYFFK